MIIQIISGFLGAGKTTFINKYISGNKDKTVIIENEFGKIGLDKKLIQGNIPVREINSGCICCSLVSDFRESIREIINEFSPDRIIIEPSGIAQLSDILKVCNFFNREYDTEILDRIVIVDMACFEDCLEDFGNFYVDQIENASIIMFSNIEKVKSNDLERIILKMKEINPEAAIFKEDWRKITSDEIETILEEARKNITEDKNTDNSDKIHSSEGHRHHSADNVFESVSLNNIKNFSEKDMEELKEKILDGFFGKVIRAKGIVPVKSEENSKISKYWHFDSNLSSFNFNRINTENLSNFNSDDKSGNVILIGSRLKKNEIEQYFLK